MPRYEVRPYTPADETAWLRCRALAFLTTPYYDDVLCAKPELPAPGFALVATDAEQCLLGVMDVSALPADGLATIDTVAVHPDHQGEGVGSALLAEARNRTAALGLSTLDAWTRDHPASLNWYRASGFAESDHYLHVYADHYCDPAEPGRAVTAASPELRPIAAFLHAGIREEKPLRERFGRVHVCRRFTLEL
ncbi:MULTISPECIES: GNAT family N-acetyltransferase [unclassified Streptomyces]|uniref:GNAT family N-acetyltransferase n=1 Tax=unclassified Streptomyces TaxID=2593676 RepID=UPI000CD4B19D|nr:MULTISPECIES: GNAT family N-acetyltransferase [unclassified Streptomyces]